MVAAEGILSLPEDRLVNLLSNLAEFRTWCGKATPAEAAAICHSDWVPVSGWTYPLVILGALELEMVVEASDPGFEYDEAGVVQAMFLQEVAEGYETNVKDAERLFKNAIGKILGAVGSLAGTGDANYPLNVVRMTLVEPNERGKKDHEDQMELEQRITVNFHWQS